MSSQSPQAMSDIAQIICLVLIILVPFALAGVALINTGLSRSRSAAHLMLATLCVISVAAIVYFASGFAWQGQPELPSHSFIIFGKEWNWIGAGPSFLRGIPLNGSRASLTALLQLFSVALAALIPLGAAAERWRLVGCCASTVLLAGITYPLFAHWVWGGGWLSRLGLNYGLGLGFLDAGGSSTIQGVGGLTALSLAWLLGPRRGKYNSEGVPAALPGHNTVLVLFGCVISVVGWMALNMAGSILFAGVTTGNAVLVAINTLLAATGGVLAGAAITRYRFGKPDASLSANSWMCGLAASSAGCAYVPPAAALLTGLIAGALVTWTIPWMETRLSIDDPSGAAAVHALGGLWGILAVGIFPRTVTATLTPGAGDTTRLAGWQMMAQAAGTNHEGQMIAQIVGIASLLGFLLPLTYAFNWLLNRVVPQRIPPEEERQGADLYELGAGAYPEFMTHSDEFSQW